MQEARAKFVLAWACSGCLKGILCCSILYSDKRFLLHNVSDAATVLESLCRIGLTYSSRNILAGLIGSRCCSRPMKGDGMCGWATAPTDFVVTPPTVIFETPQ